jgi:hypothetical protein
MNTDMLGLIGLVGMGGLLALKMPVEASRSGAGIRKLGGLLGLAGLIGFAVPPVGALGAAGALGLWNHQTGWLRVWGALGWLWPVGAVMLGVWLAGQ